jgi:spoIIIJ-associated protein
MNTTDTQLITERVMQLLQTMGIEPAQIRCQNLPPYLYIHIEAGPVGKLLIGSQGAHLAALQHVVRSILRLAVLPGTRIVVDVNGYRAQREQDLAAVADAAAKRAILQGQTVILPPMNSTDRRVIHTALAGRDDLKTISTGEEPQRAVVIKPVLL